MRFWDTSAVVPLILEQSRSAVADAWVAADPVLVIWSLTAVEITSALCRLGRERQLDVHQLEAAEAATDALCAAAHTILDVEGVKIRARRLLRVHALRAADAMQLAAAIEWAQGRPHGHVLHTFDERLGAAARIEGFRVSS